MLESYFPRRCLWADLLDRGYDAALKPLQSIGYAQMVRHLAGDIPLERAVYEIKRDTRHYAKRQITWFKKVLSKLRGPVNYNYSNHIRKNILMAAKNGILST